ncbi:MAG: hypothetical protein ACTS3T_10705 [Almyronema sp.]
MPTVAYQQFLQCFAKLRSRFSQPSAAEVAEAGDRQMAVTPAAGPPPDLALQQEILANRPFSLAEAIGREGGDFLKGECLVPRPLRAIARLNLFIDQHLCDQPGALHRVLQTWIKTDVHISQHLDTPLVALEKILASILDNPYVFNEFARQVNVQWGTLYDEIPRFQQPGQPPHPETAYPHQLIRQKLIDLQTRLQAESPT